LDQQILTFFLLKTHVIKKLIQCGNKKEEKKREKKLPIATNYKKSLEK
jgi:hypothetical protein